MAKRQGGFILFALYRDCAILVSEFDSSYKAIDGSIQKSSSPVYNGWAISLSRAITHACWAYPERFVP
jgi:hypothetical protein